MKLHQEFELQNPIDEVWSFFHDIPTMAACLPGANYLGPKEDGGHRGKISSKVGPFQTNFEGEAAVKYDDAAKTIALEGKGVDRKGGSRGKMTMNCQLESLGAATKVTVDSDVQLSGAIAQFGRTGLISEIANVLVQDFVRNAEAEMDRGKRARATPDASADQTDSMSSVPPPVRSANKPISGLSLLFLSIKGLIRSVFGKKA
ncbi:SRPBCC family protein [Consotaella aegiceratis]|uniref:SRPBCC family protein n=1 Tax=Consotaella aegiceratis TaxID=3097961 RepID=UPI002F42E0DA